MRSLLVAETLSNAQDRLKTATLVKDSTNNNDDDDDILIMIITVITRTCTPAVVL